MYFSGENSDDISIHESGRQVWRWIQSYAQVSRTMKKEHKILFGYSLIAESK